MGGVLLLDVDGVIVTGRPDDGAHWTTDLHRDLGLDPAWLAQRFFAPHWAEIVTGKKPLRPTLDQVLAPTQVTAPRLLAYWFAQDARLAPEVLAAMGRLRDRGWVIHLATNQEPLRMAHLMDHLGLADHVDGAICSAALGVAKPDPAFYHRARAAVPEGAVVFVDDTPANVSAAKALGWRAHLWQGGDLEAVVSG